MLVFLTTFNFTTTLSAGTYIVSSLGGSRELTPYGVAFFALGSLSTFGLGHHFSNRFGKLQIVFTSLFFFTATMFLTPFSSTYFVFIVFRFLSGLAGGILGQASGSIISEYAAKKDKIKVLGYLGFILTITTTLGGAFGDWIAYSYDWTWIFYLQVPILLLCLYVVYLYKKPFLSAISEPFDKVGYTAYLFTLISFVTAITLGQQLDWFRSPFICFLLVVFLVSFLFFLFWELVVEHHFMRIRLFKGFLFITAIVSVFILNSAYYGILSMISIWLHLEVSYSPLYIALVLLSMSAASILLFFTFMKLEKRLISFGNVIISILIFSIAAFYSTTFNSEVNLGRLLIAHTIIGFGYAFATFPLLLFTIRSLRSSDIDHGTSILQSTRFLAIGLGASFYSTMWWRRTVFYEERLGESLTPYSELITQTLNQTLFYAPSKGQAKELLEDALHKQSVALALSDCFYLMGWVLLGLLALGLTYAYTQRKKRKELKVFD